MHENAFAALVRRVVALANEMVYIAGSATAGQKVIGGVEPTCAFELTDSGNGLLAGLVGYLFDKSGWKDRMTAQVIRQRLTAILLEAASRRETSGIEVGVRSLVQEHAGLTAEYLVVLPLVGLSGCREPLQFGRVTLRWYDQATSRDLAERCRSVIAQNPNYPDEFKQRRFESMDASYHNKLSGRVCSEFRVTAGPERAVELAEEATRQAIDLLRYAILFSHPKEDFRSVGLLGEVPDDTSATVAVRTDGQGCYYSGAVVNHGFELTPERTRRMSTNEVFTLSDMIAGEPPPTGSMGTVILRAVHWLASAQSQVENENALLSLVTCLETFFKAEKDVPISALLADGTALLTAKDKPTRLSRRDRVRYFYSKRSKLTHEGNGSVTHDELLELTLICRDLTLIMIRNRDRFKDHADFRRWLDEQKFGTEIEYPQPTTGM